MLVFVFCGDDLIICISGPCKLPQDTVAPWNTHSARSMAREKTARANSRLAWLPDQNNGRDNNDEKETFSEVMENKRRLLGHMETWRHVELPFK